MKTKTCLLLLWLWFASLVPAWGQVVLEHLSGLRQQNFLTYWQKDLDKAQRWNCFFFHQLIIDHRFEDQSALSTEANLSYGLNRWFGLSLGFGYEGAGFSPNVGVNLSFLNSRGDFFLEAYPTLRFVSGLQPGLFGIAAYQPALSKNWSLSGQLVFAADPHFTNQQWLQFGLGLDHTWLLTDNKQWTNPGLFLRVAL